MSRFSSLVVGTLSYSANGVQASLTTLLTFSKSLEANIVHETTGALNRQLKGKHSKGDDDDSDEDYGVGSEYWTALYDGTVYYTVTNEDGYTFYYEAVSTIGNRGHGYEGNESKDGKWSKGSKESKKGKKSKGSSDSNDDRSYYQTPVHHAPVHHAPVHHAPLRQSPEPRAPAPVPAPNGVGTNAVGSNCFNDTANVCCSCDI